MIIISATGRDRPGMVAAISQKLFDANCNIEDATMTRLSGEFAMILVVAPPPAWSTPEQAELLSEHLKELRASHGLRLHCNDFDSDQKPSTPDTSSARWMLSVYGPDRTGLVARVAGILAKYKINISDLQTRVASGHELYVMIFELELPLDFELEILRQSLAAAAQELGLEYSLNAIEEDAL